MQSPYDEEYFLRGKQSGKSLYENYRWLPDLTIPMARRMIEHCGIAMDDTVLDFGCSRGYLVKAMREIGFCAYGQDISDWAIANCDPDVTQYVSVQRPAVKPDWIIAKDVLEHLTSGELLATLEAFGTMSSKGIFVVVPLSNDGKVYVVPEYEEDVTHKQRLSLLFWVSVFHTVLKDTSWEIASRYRIEGIKDNYAHFPRGNGFITCKRIISRTTGSSKT